MSVERLYESPSVVFIATCVIVGPVVGLLLLFVATTLLFGAGVAVSQEAQLRPLALGAFFVAIFLLPVFAMVGVVVMLWITVPTGIALALLRRLRISERVRSVVPVWPALVEAVIAFAVAYLIAAALAGYVNAKALAKVSTIGMPLLCAISAAICNHLCVFYLLRPARSSAS